MLTKEENERLTQVGPGTPMGELLRRYWHPIATDADLERERVLHGARPGRGPGAVQEPQTASIGLVQERCPHRSASLAYGIPHDDGLRCPYHGWLFNGEGTLPGAALRRHRRRGRWRHLQRQDSRRRLPGARRWAAWSGPIWARRAARPCCRAGTAFVTRGCQPQHRHHRAAVQLAAVHGELAGPGALRVAARQPDQLRGGEARRRAR